MYTPHFLLYCFLELLASILLALILTAELDVLLWHATDCTRKLPSELYITIIIHTCFACVHFYSMWAFLSNLRSKLSLKACQQQQQYLILAHLGR